MSTSGISGSSSTPPRPSTPEKLGGVKQWRLREQQKLENPPPLQTAAKSQEVFQESKCTEKESYDARYVHNYAFIFNTTSKDLSFLYVANGQLAKSPQETSFEQQEEAKELIDQVWRQTNGKLIDADYGYKPREEALFSLNKLKAHLETHIPECSPRSDPEKPLQVLSGTYKSEPPAELPPEIRAAQQMQKAKTEQKVAEVRAQNIQHVPIGGDHMVQADWVRTQEAHAQNLAVRKAEDDAFMAKIS